MKNEFKREAVLVSVNNVVKQYGEKLILRDIGTAEHPFIIHNVRRPNMQQGQTVAVLGPSGSGKSTLFRLIAGIEQVSAGTVTIPVSGNASHYREVQAGDIGFVQQTYPLSRNQTVLSMLNDAASQGSVPKGERKALINSYLEIWGLKDQRYLAARQLSGGQRQRVAIIEQLLCSHYFVLFDEPFSGLDVKNIEDVKNSFKKITTSSEINTIIFSTHDIHLAVELSDTIFVLGYERGPNGEKLPGGTVIKSFDLMEMGLAWEGFSPAHYELSQQIESLIKGS